MVWQERIYGSCIVGGVKYMNKKTILSIALVCVLLVSSGAVASGVFSSFAREKAPMEFEEQKISPMVFLPELPLPPGTPPVMPFPPDIPPEIPLPPELPFPPEEPPVELPELPEVITVNMILNQLENNVTFPEVITDEFGWFLENMTLCLEKYPNPNDDLTNQTNLTAFIQYVVDWWNEWLKEHGNENPLYAQVIEAAIKWLEEWLESPGNLDELIEQFVKYMQTFIEELITIPVPEIPIPPEIPILPGF